MEATIWKGTGWQPVRGHGLYQHLTILRNMILHTNTHQILLVQSVGEHRKTVISGQL